MSGHPWLFKSHLAPEFTQAAAGQTGLYPVGEHWFFFSPQSEISLRRLGPATRLWSPHLPEGDESARTPITDVKIFTVAFGPWLRQHFVERFHAKAALVPGENCFRWIFSECDLVPGLVIDRFEGDVVAQIQTAPIEHFWPAIRSALLGAMTEVGLPRPRLHELRRSKSRAKEGLNVETAAIGVEAGEGGRWIRWNGLAWKMNPGAGQKTGAYFDQKENHWAAVHWGQSFGAREAWDLCCFEGGFGLHLAQQGIDVLAVDDSQAALDAAQLNAEHNGLRNFRTEKADVFDFLRARFDARAKTDLIVLDPPGVAGAQKHLASALKGLKELNLRALHCLKPGGVLVTCTCSHSVGPEELQRVMAEAAHDSRRSVRLLERRGPAADHAPLVGFPESEYLQAWYLEVR